jgi:hypothetical protein
MVERVRELLSRSDPLRLRIDESTNRKESRMLETPEQPGEGTQEEEGGDGQDGGGSEEGNGGQESGTQQS